MKYRQIIIVLSIFFSVSIIAPFYAQQGYHNAHVVEVELPKKATTSVVLKHGDYSTIHQGSNKVNSTFMNKTRNLLVDTAVSFDGDKVDLKHGTKGILMCNGVQTDSEVIYWRNVPGDSTYESPITPHHGEHHDIYATFRYDLGGWNNIRMGLEIMVVTAHAMGRTLVKTHKYYFLIICLKVSRGFCVGR
jgi:hypothetical protein